MNQTKYYDELPIEVQSKIDENGSNFFMHLQLESVGKRNNRSFVYEIENQDLIYKEFQDKGRDDNDIIALLDFEDCEYFPKLYAYQEKIGLVMSRAKGRSLDNLLEGKLESKDAKEILEQFREATYYTIEKGYYDTDFKLEHLFWDAVTRNITLVDLGHYRKEQPLNKNGEISNIDLLKNIFNNFNLL